ncbi:hypothetical protein VTH82DRAFT_2151 [Thermothelomyces myriococcoides]
MATGPATGTRSTTTTGAKTRPRAAASAPGSTAAAPAASPGTPPGTWQGGENNVKSFANCGLQVPQGRTISSINNLQTSISWSYSNTNIRANVAYDLFTAADPNHDHSSGDYELMIWLAKYGDVYPIGSSAGYVNVAGQDWELWTGYNGAMRVYSFIAPSPRNSFSANVKEFFNYLESAQGFPASSQYLLIFQAGTEPFTGGETTFTVNNFSASVA